MANRRSRRDIREEELVSALVLGASLTVRKELVLPDLF